MHAEAEREQRGIVVYLLPGLTAAQRKAALRRLRQAGSRGCGPRLPSAQLTVALAVDRLRSAVGNTAAAVRQHPVGMLLPAVLAGALLAVFVSVSVYVRMAGAMAPVPVPGRAGAASWSAPAGAPGQAGLRAGTLSDFLSADAAISLPSAGVPPFAGVTAWWAPAGRAPVGGYSGRRGGS